MDIKLESEWLPDGEDQWGHKISAAFYRAEGVDDVITELQAEVDSWKAAAETFEDFYRKTEVERDELVAELENLKVDAVSQLDEQSQELYKRRFEIADLQSELTKARELLTSLIANRDASENICNSERARVRVFLAHQSVPVAKNLTNQSPNQCDGCQAGIPI